MVTGFTLARLPEIRFGAGTFGTAVDILKSFGNRILIVTGKRSFFGRQAGAAFLEKIERSGIDHTIVNVDSEPTTTFVDTTVGSIRNNPPDAVISIGGGSVLDAGKAISAMIPVEGKVWDYLEGNPDIMPHPGKKIPFIAVPTTSGTGSEATKNAVLSTVGKPELKRSLRHDNFVPDVAIIDPLLVAGCPPGVTAASGLDAITQLLEGYVSTKASVMTDLFAFSGLERGLRSIRKVIRDGEDIEGRSDMAYAALLSGIVLASAGLGVVHGFASVLGGHYRIPHGVVCGTLLGAATRKTIDRIRESKSGIESFKKYADAGRLTEGADNRKNDEYCMMKLADYLDLLISDLQIPRLGVYGVTREDIPGLAKETGIKNNPVALDHEDLEKILLSRL